jgi:hypothetical protein
MKMPHFEKLALTILGLVMVADHPGPPVPLGFFQERVSLLPALTPNESLPGEPD